MSKHEMSKYGTKPQPRLRCLHRCDHYFSGSEQPYRVKWTLYVPRTRQRIVTWEWEDMMRSLPPFSSSHIVRRIYTLKYRGPLASFEVSR